MDPENGRAKLDPEVLYLLIALLICLYVFIVNYFVASSPLQEWFEQYVPWPLAVVNVGLLACLFIALIVYAGKLRFRWRYALLIAFAGFGTFLQISMARAPITSWLVILVAGVVYSVLWRKKNQAAKKT